MRLSSRLPSPRRRVGPPTRLALALAALVAASTVHAQSLKDLYDAAAGYDATYLAARAVADSTQYRLEQARALKRPSLNLVGGYTRSYTDTESFGSGGSGTTQAQFNGRQPLFNRADSATIDQAVKGVEISQADLDSAEQDLILRVTQAYFDVLGAQDTLAFSHANKAFITEQLAAAKRNFEVGTATITDTREAQARFDLATATEIAADNDLLVKKAALDTLVGRRGVDPKPLLTPVALPSLTGDPLDVWVGRAESQHPAVRRALLGLDIARLETAKARAGHLPTVDAVASLANSNGTGVALNTTPGRFSTASVGVQVTVPLFAGFAVQNRIKETLVLEDKSQNDLDFAKRSVVLATRQAYFTVQSGEAQVRALEAAESSSQLALDATQLGYKVGVRVNVDVLNAQTQLFSTRRDLSKARYDLLVGSLRLRQAAGQLHAQDIAPIDGLIAR